MTNKLSTYFKREIEFLYLLGIVFTFLGALIDIISLGSSLSTPVFAIDLLLCIATIVLLLLKLFKHITIQTSYFALSFFIIFTLNATYIYHIISDESFSVLFLRDSIVIPLLIFSVGFIVNKKAILYIGILQIVLFPILALLSNDAELLRDVVFIEVMMFAAVYGFYLFVGSMEKAVSENRKHVAQIETQNIHLEKLNADLEKSNSAKNKMLSIIGHDLRGPIGNIEGMIGFLKDDDLNETEEREIVDTIQETANSTYSLLLNLLTWARADNGDIEYAPSKENIYSIITSATDLIAVSASLKSISIINKSSKTASVWCDIEMVKTIVRNLLSNAIKFTPKEGEIAISTEVKSNDVVISVADTGVGISPKVMEKIFSSQKSSSTTGTENEEGTGLGLDLCKNFVHQNKGKFWAESIPKQGSTFFFSLPLSKK